MYLAFIWGPGHLRTTRYHEAEPHVDLLTPNIRLVLFEDKYLPT